MFVLGVDPGLSRCGYGLVRRDGRQLTAEAAGVIRTDPNDALAKRLADLQYDIRTLIEEQKPDEIALRMSSAQRTGRRSSGPVTRNKVN